MPKNPILSFRSNELIENYIAEEQKKDEKLGRSEIVKALLERAIKTPVEKTQQENVITLYLLCPQQNKIVKSQYCAHDCPKLIDCSTFGLLSEQFEELESIKRASLKTKKKEELIN